MLLFFGRLRVRGCLCLRVKKSTDRNGGEEVWHPITAFDAAWKVEDLFADALQKGRIWYASSASTMAPNGSSAAIL